MEYKEINGKYYLVLETESFETDFGTERIYVLKDDFGDIIFTILHGYQGGFTDGPIQDIRQLLNRLEITRKGTWRNHGLKEHRIKTLQWGISRIQEQKREEKLDELLNPKKENIWHFA
jgi:hypothetical protein